MKNRKTERKDKMKEKRKDKKMKKFLAVLLTLCILAGFSAVAFADAGPVTGTQPNYLSWATAKRVVDGDDLAGRFVRFGSYNIDMWVPNELEEMQDLPEDYLAYFRTEDKSAEVGVQIQEVPDDFSLEAYEQELEEQGLVDGGMYVINGFYGLLFMNEETQNMTIAFMSDENEALLISFFPVSNQDLYAKAKIMLASIQPDSLSLYGLADMLDTDLMEFWGNTRKVTFNEADESIHISIWDEGSTADTINHINNWDEVKEDKIALYDYYADLLEGLGAGDVHLTLQYVADKDDDAFLTIIDGEVVYDALAA